MKKGNVERFDAICARMTELYEKKNVAYGDSFHKSFLEEGLAMPRIRLGDKMNRFKTLSKRIAQRMEYAKEYDKMSERERIAKGACNEDDEDEPLVDTLIDLANYAVMTIMELEQEERVQKWIGNREDDDV